MKYALSLTAAGALLLGVQAEPSAAQINSQAVPPAPLQLSEQDKAVVVGAAIEAKSHQTTPKEFTPAVGASVPSSVFLHAFNPETAGKVRALKHYWYAYLDREIALIDAMQKKVVAVIQLPVQSMAVGQGHQGAAEPAESKREDGASSTDSIPAYTAPETNK